VLATKHWLAVGCVGLLLAGCGGNRIAKQEQEMQARTCESHQVQRAIKTRHTLLHIQPGITSVKKLSNLGKPSYKAALVRAYEPPLAVVFYPLSNPACPWLADGPTYLPVIYNPAKGTVIKGYGIETLKQLQTEGWQLGQMRSRFMGEPLFTPIPWPWQNWDYSYVPRQ
jgi:hypothetical protein